MTTTVDNWRNRAVRRRSEGMEWIFDRMHALEDQLSQATRDEEIDGLRHRLDELERVADKFSL